MYTYIRGDPYNVKHSLYQKKTLTRVFFLNDSFKSFTPLNDNDTYNISILISEVEYYL